MRKADFQSRIKKIEIVNKVLTEGWQQSIRVILGDIELSNENLLELRQFRPNEPVMVTIEPVQMTIFAGAGAPAPTNGGRKKAARSEELAADDPEDDGEFITFVEEDGRAPAGKVVK